jgi:hypothetical protein
MSESVDKIVIHPHVRIEEVGLSSFATVAGNKILPSDEVQRERILSDPQIISHQLPASQASKIS